MKIRRFALVLALALGLLTTGAGGWETEFEFANNEAFPLTVFAGEQACPPEDILWGQVST